MSTVHTKVIYDGNRKLKCFLGKSKIVLKTIFAPGSILKKIKLGPFYLYLKKIQLGPILNLFEFFKFT